MPADPSSPQSAEAVAGRVRSAFFDPGSHLRLWGIAGAALWFDLWSKAKAFEVLKPLDVRDAIPGVLMFRRSVNAGALFGMGKGMVPLFIVASVVALAFVLYMFALSAPNRRSLHVALAFVFAGSMGNLYDRVFIVADRISVAGKPPMLGKIVDDDGVSEYIHVGTAPDGEPPDGHNLARFRRDEVEIIQVGVVRDFLKFAKIGGVDVWPWIFNVADSLLVVGVAVLLINFQFERKATEPEPPADGAHR